MPLERPTRAALLARARAEIEARLPGADARLRRSILDTLARIISEQSNSLFGFLQYHVKQAFPQLASAEYLRRFAELYAVPEIPPEFSRGSVTMTGTNGVVVPQDTSLRRADGRLYLTTTEVTIDAGTAVAPVIAVEAGADGDAEAGTVLTFESAQAGVAVQTVVDVNGLTGGSDVESDESLRERVLLRIQKPPAGGTVYDYQRQAKLYPGVTDVFVNPLQDGPGTVGVAPLFYDRDDPIPVAGDLSAIQALLDDPFFKPVCADVNVYALDPIEVDFTLEIEPDNSAVRAAVIAELQALFRREATPGGVILISHIREAISSAAGETDNTLTTPNADIDLGGDLDEISVVGDFTWV